MISNEAQLQNLNTLLAATIGSDPDIAAQIRKAIHYARRMKHNTELDPGPGSIRRVTDLHLQHRPDWALAICDLSNCGRDPLFLRSHLLASLRHLAGARDAVLVVTGLAQNIRPPGKRWSERRRQEYHSGVELIHSIVARLISPCLRIRILVV